MAGEPVGRREARVFLEQREEAGLGVAHVGDEAVDSDRFGRMGLEPGDGFGHEARRALGDGRSLSVGRPEQDQRRDRPRDSAVGLGEVVGAARGVAVEFREESGEFP